MLQTQIKDAIKHKKEAIEAAERVTPSTTSDFKIDGLTRQDVETIIKDLTGGLSGEAIQYLKDRFQADRLRK